ncbi:dual specificity protein phosphatase 8-like [Amblyraja radiata]|uniref:dual specificity protein phosphatase 8-like n=1 Tax=Amblyraja radiata TaxID=386614 RepID=UPI001402BD6F|nr:dual specificity protein phosphatase 8-like [Amblyraja radiata]
MAGDKELVKALDADQLAAMLEKGTERVLVIDCRPLADYSLLHVLGAVNVCTSTMVEGRDWLAQLLPPQSPMERKELVFYDQETDDVQAPVPVGNLNHLLREVNHFSNVYFLKGGFVEFSSCFPSLCEGRAPRLGCSFSQPCLSTTDLGPTQILPCFYLGSQTDVLNKDLMVQNRITHILNVSSNCPKPAFIPDSHFLRIPVNDSYCDSLLPWLNKSVEFIDKVRATRCRILVHCLAGISRSAAIAIAYVMRTMDLPLDDAYRYVKDRRPTISPNFNFLGQLVEYEKTIQVHACAQVTQLHLEPADAPGGVGRSQCGTSEGPNDDRQMLIPRLPDECRAEPDNGTRQLARRCEDGSPELAALGLGVANLRLSPGRAAHASCMKWSFSLDVKAAYPSVPPAGCCPRTPLSAETAPAPKLLGLGGKLAAGTFNPFTLLFGSGRRGRGGKEDHPPRGGGEVGAAQTRRLRGHPPPVGPDHGRARTSCPSRREDGTPGGPRLSMTLPIPNDIAQPKSPLLNYNMCLLNVRTKRTELSLFDHPFSGPIKASHVTGNTAIYAENMVES